MCVPVCLRVLVCLSLHTYGLLCMLLCVFLHSVCVPPMPHGSCVCVFVCVCACVWGVWPDKPSPLQLQQRESRAVEHTWGRGSVGDCNSGCACVEMRGRDQRLGVRVHLCMLAERLFIYFFFLTCMFASCGACLTMCFRVFFCVYVCVCVCVCVCQGMDRWVKASQLSRDFHTTQGWFSARAESHIHSPLTLADGLPHTNTPTTPPKQHIQALYIYSLFLILVSLLLMTSWARKNAFQRQTQMHLWSQDPLSPFNPESSLHCSPRARSFYLWILLLIQR